tara:strand:+ start:8589 stop:9245 length:657 start_codon:yes stop_codon:yes gene_type:complete
MSFRTTLNKVLVRLREDTISSDWSGAINDSTAVDDYQKLIGEFVNEAKQIVEDSWNWGALRTVISLNTTSGTSQYTITGVNNRSRILQVIDSTNNVNLTQTSDNYFYRVTHTGSSSNGIPSYYRLNNNTIDFWNTPGGTYAIKIHAVDAPDDLTNAADTILVQENLIVLGAYALALSERGEDGGTPSDQAMLRFKTALTDAISQDSQRTVDETTWYAS